MAYVLNSTNLEQVDGGFLVKQGDVASTFAFNLGMILPAGLYRIEVTVGGYTFPSDDSTQIRITKSDKNLVTNEVHALKELDIAEEVKKQLAGRSVGSDGTVSQEFPDLLFYYNLGKV